MPPTHIQTMNIEKPTKSVNVILETDNNGFTFVKNHADMPYWLVDKIESQVEDTYKPDNGYYHGIGRVIYDPENKTIVETKDW